MKLHKLLALTLAGILLTGCNKEAGPLPEPVEPGSIETLPAATEPTIYEANPRFFGTNNCLQGLNSNIDRIANMGVDILWIMPIFTPGELKSVGSPYCVKDFTGINSRYGNEDDMRAIVKSAHDKGMKVILDWMANHTAWDHAWITQHPNWYTQDGSGQIISPPGMGWDDVADLNYDNAEMRAEMIKCMLYWVKNFDIDGFRCDYADGVPHDFWEDAIGQLKGAKASIFMLAAGNDFGLYDDGFDMLYDWGFNTTLQDLFNGKATIAELNKKVISTNAQIPEGKQIMRYAINHDVIAEKAPAKLFGSNSAMCAAYVLASVMSGAPLIYSGQEAGFNGATSFFNYTTLTWNDDLVKAYTAINSAFHDGANARGGVRQVRQSGKAIIVTWVNGNNAMVALVNPTGNEMDVKMPMYFTRTTMKDCITGTTAQAPASVKLNPYGYQLFVK